jgi:GNAT superfamily N-acetyltransferase
MSTHIVAAVAEIRVKEARSDADLERSLEICNAVHAPHRESLSGVHEAKRRALDFAVFNAFLEGGSVGAAHVDFPSHSDTPGADIYILHAFRGRGIGGRLFHEVSAWLVDRGRSELRGSVTEGDEQSLAFAERRGFVEFSRDLLVELDLTAVDKADVEPPAGIEIVPLAERPDLALGVYEVACEAWPDVPNTAFGHLEPFEQWCSAYMHGADIDPRAVFVALAGNEVVGYAKLTFSEAQPKTAFHDMTGVKRAWRGRGIARALKQTQIAWAKAEGFERLQTANEVRNAPIRRLNDEFGYRPITGRIRLRGPVASARRRAPG